MENAVARILLIKEVDEGDDMKSMFRYFLVFAMCFGVSNVASARRAKQKDAKYKRVKQKRKKGYLASSISEAMNRSHKDQGKIKTQYNNEADQRVETWTDRKRNTIKISHTGTTSMDPVDLGDPDFSMEDLGEDQSGLDGLRGDVVEEPIVIDFDEELREVSSLKD